VHHIVQVQFILASQTDPFSFDTESVRSPVGRGSITTVHKKSRQVRDDAKPIPGPREVNSLYGTDHQTDSVLVLHDTLTWMRYAHVDVCTFECPVSCKASWSIERVKRRRERDVRE
jgi:hypothetical protein